jgi:hypothetical protein
MDHQAAQLLNDEPLIPNVALYQPDGQKLAATIGKSYNISKFASMF